MTLVAEAGLPPVTAVQSPAVVQHTPSHDNALLLAAEGRVDAAVSVPPVYNRMPPEIRDRLRPLGSVGEAFAVIYLAAPHLEASLVAQLERQLIAFPQTDAGRHFGSPPLVRAAPSDLEMYTQFELALRRRIEPDLND